MYHRSQAVKDIINNRKIILGNTEHDRIRGLSLVKYPWSRDMFDLMVKNNWIPQEINMIEDIRDYNEASPEIRQMFDRALAFLSNLDAIQVDNLASNIIQHVTDPTIGSCIRRQIYEEEIHVQAYGTIIETIVDDPERIYDMYNVVPELENKNSYIVSSGNSIRNEELTLKSFLKAVVSNIVLEGVYFYSGFLAFYSIINSTGRFIGTVDQIKYINRDEICHLHLFALIFDTLVSENPNVLTEEDYEDFRTIIRNGVELETAWGKYVIGEGTCGLTAQGIEEYNKYIANERVKLIGMQPLYPNATNPYPYVTKYEMVNERQSNFFERKVDTYSSTSLSFERA